MGGVAAKPRDEQRTVLVVGAGYAGIACAKELEKHFRVIVVERRSFLLHKVGYLRSTVLEGWTEALQIPLRDALEEGNVVQDECVSVGARKVRGVSGDECEFDYLVLALGSTNSFPGTSIETGEGLHREGTRRVFDEIRQQVRKSGKIVVVGGGAVGCELAGEILTLNQDLPKEERKDVVLVSRSEKLGHSELPDNVSSQIREKLEDMGCTVLVGYEVQGLPQHAEGAIECSKVTVSKVSSGGAAAAAGTAEDIDADLVLVCTGMRPNTDVLLKGDAELQASLDERAYIRTNLKGQVLKNYERARDTGSEEHYPNIFAVGDCAMTEQKEWKMAYVGGERAKHIAQNIISLEYKGKEKMTDLPVHPSVMLIPFGTERGVAALPMGFTTGDFMVRNIKGKLLMTDMFWSRLGAPSTPTVSKQKGSFQTLEVPSNSKGFALKRRMSETASPKVKLFESKEDAATSAKLSTTQADV